MTAVVIIVLSFFHLSLFLGASFFFYTFYKRENYGSKELLTFLLSILTFSTIGFFFCNHFSFLSSDSSLLLAVGYAAFPLTQFASLLLVYPIYMMTYKFTKLKLAPIFLGIVASTATTLLIVSTLSQFYWAFLGRSIYG